MERETFTVFIIYACISQNGAFNGPLMEGEEGHDLIYLLRNERYNIIIFYRKTFVL